MDIVQPKTKEQLIAGGWVFSQVEIDPAKRTELRIAIRNIAEDREGVSTPVCKIILQTKNVPEGAKLALISNHKGRKRRNGEHRPAVKKWKIPARAVGKGVPEGQFPYEVLHEVREGISEIDVSNIFLRRNAEEGTVSPCKSRSLHRFGYVIVDQNLNPVSNAIALKLSSEKKIFGNLEEKRIRLQVVQEPFYI